MTAAPPWLDEAKQRIIGFEGEVRNKAGRHALYRCPAGKLTIGHGHNVEDLGLSDAVVDMIDEENLAAALAELDQRIPWWREHPKEVGIVLFDMMFNMGWGDGTGGLSSFRAMLPAIRAQQYEYAARLMRRSKYARDVGDRAKENAALLERAAQSGE